MEGCSKNKKAALQPLMLFFAGEKELDRTPSGVGAQGFVAGEEEIKEFGKSPNHQSAKHKSQ